MEMGQVTRHTQEPTGWAPRDTQLFAEEAMRVPESCPCPGAEAEAWEMCTDPWLHSQPSYFMVTGQPGAHLVIPWPASAKPHESRPVL